MTTSITDYSRIIDQLKSCRYNGGIHLEECTNKDNKTKIKDNCKCELCSKKLNFLDVTKERIPCCEKTYMIIFQEEIMTHINSEAFSIDLYNVDECMKKATDYKRVDCVVFIFSRNNKDRHPHIVLIEDKCTASNVSRIIGKKGVSYLSKQIITQEITRGDKNYKETLNRLFEEHNQTADKGEKLTEDDIDKFVSHLQPLVQLRGTIKWLKELFSRMKVDFEERNVTPLLLVGGKKFYRNNYSDASDCEIIRLYKNVVRPYKDLPAKKLCKKGNRKAGFEDRSEIWKKIIDNRGRASYKRLVEIITE